MRALVTRALALDEGWSSGAIHEAMIAVEGIAGAGRRVAGAGQRALRACGDAIRRPFGVCLRHAGDERGRTGDRAEFEKLLKQALAVDLYEAAAAARQPGRSTAGELLLAHAERLFR